LIKEKARYLLTKGRFINKNGVKMTETLDKRGKCAYVCCANKLFNPLTKTKNEQS